MSTHAKRSAIVLTLIASATLLVACTGTIDPGIIPSAAPINGSGTSPEPSPTSDDWYSAPVPEVPDWNGIDIEALTINSEPYRILDGSDHYTNVGRIPEVRDPEWVKLLEDIVAGERAKEFPEPERAEADLQEYLDSTLEEPPAFDPTVPFTVELTPSSCTTQWTEDSAQHVDEDGQPGVLEPSIFLAKSENATEGVPFSCSAADYMSTGEGASASAWFIDREFSDGKYFIIATVDGSRYRQVTPVTLSGPTIPRGCRGICDNEEEIVWQEAITTETTVGEFGELVSTGVVSGIEYIYDGSVQTEPPGSASAYPELVLDEAPKAEERWWEEPKSDAYFSVSDVELTGSGSNSDPVSGGFTVTLTGEHRTTLPSTWILGRDPDAESGPALSCLQGEGEGYAVHFECEIEPFVDSQGKAVGYYLIATSEPGNIRQVIKLPVE